MPDFDIFLSKLLEKPSSDTIIMVDGVKHVLKGITKLSSLNYRQNLDYYYKVFFTDPAVLIIIPKLKTIQFSKEGDLGNINNISDNDIGKLEIVDFNNKKYHLENANDYQYTLDLIFGSFEDVEGECRFSDYINVEDDDDSLSLGWLVKDGHRADINSHTISLSQIKIINSSKAKSASGGKSK